MPLFSGSPWPGVVVAVVAVVVVLGLLMRYRALDRAGSPLPPGAGGARLIGTTGTVSVAHEPGVARGRVLVLGDEWGVADDVSTRLTVGDTVVVDEVVGTRLVVTPPSTTTDRGT